MLNFGLIGAGKHGSRYLRHLMEDIPGGRLCCIHSRREGASFGAGVEVFNDLGRFLASDLDVVIITTPTGIHKDLTVRSLEAGKHVLVEKPMAGDPEDCTEMIEASKRSGMKLMVAQTLRYDPTILETRRLMEDRSISRISMEQLLEPPQEGSWLYADIAEGGVLLNTGVHVFDSIRFLTGSDIIFDVVKTEQVLNRRWDDRSEGTFHLESSVKGSFHISRTRKLRRRVVEIHGEDLCMISDTMKGTVTMNDRTFSADGEKRTIIPLMKDLIECIEKDLPVPISGEDGRAAVEACTEAYRISS